MDSKATIVSRIYDLYGAADHVSQLAQTAQVAAERGAFGEALRYIELANQSATSITFRRDDAIAALKRGLSEVLGEREATDGNE